MSNTIPDKIEFYGRTYDLKQKDLTMSWNEFEYSMSDEYDFPVCIKVTKLRHGTFWKACVYNEYVSHEGPNGRTFKDVLEMLQCDFALLEDLVWKARGWIHPNMLRGNNSEALADYLFGFVGHLLDLQSLVKSKFNSK